MFTLSRVEELVGTKEDSVATTTELAQFGEQLLPIFHIHVVYLVGSKEAIYGTQGSKASAVIDVYTHWKTHNDKSISVRFVYEIK